MKRKCPVCSVDMNTINIDKQTIDQCASCGGSYYDEGELEQLLTVFRYYESIYIEEEEIENVPEKDEQRVLHCPKDNSLMSPEDVAAIIVDRCSSCGGIWLDKGELTALQLAQKSIQDNLNLYIRLGQ